MDCIKPKRSTTQRRHRMVFINYIRIIKGYGKDALNMSKGSLYEKAGTPFGYDERTSGRIIREGLKMPKESLNKILMNEEAGEYMSIVLGLNE